MLSVLKICVLLADGTVFLLPKCFISYFQFKLAYVVLYQLAYKAPSQQTHKNLPLTLESFNGVKTKLLRWFEKILLEFEQFNF